MTMDVGRVGEPTGLGSAYGRSGQASCPDPSGAIPRASATGCSMLALGGFLGLWVLGVWMTPHMVNLAKSLPFGLGAPAFVIGGTAVTALATFAPLLIWAFFASAIEARSDATGTGAVEGESAASEAGDAQ